MGSFRFLACARMAGPCCRSKSTTIYHLWWLCLRMPEMSPPSKFTWRGQVKNSIFHQTWNALYCTGSFSVYWFYAEVSVAARNRWQLFGQGAMQSVKVCRLEIVVRVTDFTHSQLEAHLCIYSESMGVGTFLQDQKLVITEKSTPMCRHITDVCEEGGTEPSSADPFRKRGPNVPSGHMMC